MPQAPSAPAIGDEYSDLHKTFVWNGTTWEPAKKAYLLAASAGVSRPAINPIVGDHLDLTVITESQGSGIGYDTVSPYTNVFGASVGRITLSGKRFQLTGMWMLDGAVVPQDTVKFQFSTVATAPTLIGRQGRSHSGAFNANNGFVPASAFVDTFGGIVQVELQLTMLLTGGAPTFDTTVLAKGSYIEVREL